MSTPPLNKYDLYNMDAKQHVYEIYDQMRAESPVMLQHGLQQPVWFVTGYESAKQVLGDHRRFVREYRSTLTEAELAKLPPMHPLIQVLTRNMLLMDKPDHTRLRAIVSQAFTNRRIQALAPRIQQIADELIDDMLANGENSADLISAYAFQLPIIVICELLGVPANDRDSFRVWSAAFVEFSPNEQFMQLMVSFVQYIERMVLERRITPQDDLLSALVHAEANGEQLNEMELYSMVMLLIVAGHETTANLIANGMLALLQHPEQTQQLRNNPDQIPDAIEEFLRYDGSVERTTARFASEDVELCGQAIPRSSAVIVVLGAANRDPTMVENADALNISRQNNKHLGFGYGIHYCLGAPLARLEGQIAVETLLRRIPSLQLATSVETLSYRPSTLVRGLVALPIHW